MDYLYAPWRDDYIKDKKKKECVFCSIYEQDRDRENGVLYKDEDIFIVMNAYPYTPGHFMVIPKNHLQTLDQVPPALWRKLSSGVHESAKIVKKTLRPDGINLGMNIEAAAGAGIAEHLHYHIVPRWRRDTNFITAVGQTRVYSTDFDEIYRRLLEAFAGFSLPEA